MRIAVFHNLPLGGAKRTLYEQVKHLSKRNKIDLFIYESTNESFLDLCPFVDNVTYIPFDIKSNLSGFLSRLHSDFNNFIILYYQHKLIADKINTESYDFALIHADKYTQAPYILRFLKIPNIYFCQEYLRMVYESELSFDKKVIFYKKYYELLTRKVRKAIDRDNAKSAQRILANSRFTKNKIDRAFNIKSKVCHLGVDASLFKNINMKKGEKYILFIGKESKIEGYNLVKKMLEYTSKKYKLKIKSFGAGKGTLDVTDDKMMAKYYSNAIATICVEYNEPFGIVPIESMACETPVLAVDEGGYKETVIDGVTGYLLKRDPKEFAEKLTFLINNPAIAKKMGKNGRKHVKKKFSWNKHNNILENEINKLAKGKQK